MKRQVSCVRVNYESEFSLNLTSIEVLTVLNRLLPPCITVSAKKVSIVFSLNEKTLVLFSPCFFKAGYFHGIL